MTTFSETIRDKMVSEQKVH